MKPRSVLISLFVLLAYSGYTDNVGKILNAEPEAAQVRSWMQNQPVKFLENKGQMADMEGKPVPFVLFKAEAPGLDMYITEKGITYTFIQAEEKENEQTEKENKEKMFAEKDENIIFKWERVDMELKDASIKKENISKKNPSTSDYNYFYGHCAEGIYGVKQFEKIVIREIYPGIDWVLYNSSDKGFKYDFVVHPGADPKQIQLIYSSANPLILNKFGEIKIKTDIGTLTENAPYSYIKETDQEVASSFQIIKAEKYDDYCRTTLAFSLNSRFIDQHSTLIIDPQLNWSTFYGGSGLDGFMSIAADNSGNVYVTGYATSANFPVQSSGAAYFSGVSAGNNDVIIVRFSNSGVLIWATYFGGSNSDVATSIVVDNSGNIYVTGRAFFSATFPTKSWGGAYYDNTFGGLSDAFILRFSSTGTLDWSTLYGGSSNDYGYSIAIDPSSGGIYVTGNTLSADFPTQPWGAAYLDNIYDGDDIFVIRFSNTGVLDWSTLYGGTGPETGRSIYCDISGNTYVTGYSQGTFPTFTWTGAYNDPSNNGIRDIFILRFSNTGTRTWATLYGGSASEMGITVRTDVSGNIFISGYTKSANFPTQSWGAAYFDNALGGISDAFILRFSNAGIRTWSSFVGGSGIEEEEGLVSNRAENEILALDPCGNIYLALFTTSTDIITINAGCGAYFDNTSNGLSDQFLAKFSGTGNLIWSTYLGGDGDDLFSSIIIDNNSNLFVTGEWMKKSGSPPIIDSSYPTIDPGGGAYFDNSYNGDVSLMYSDDSFIAKFTPIIPTLTQSQNNNTTCGPCNGTATITVNCGNPNYSYSWSNGSSTLNSTNAINTITGLCPGTYTVTITSNCNKIQTAAFVISGTMCGGLSVNVNSAEICSGVMPCPVITATGTGGAAPYTYTWNTAETTQNINPCPVSTNTYTVTITDAGGNMATSAAIVTVNPAVTVTTIPLNISCSGNTNGSAGANPSGGTPLYSYTWNNGQTTQTVSNLAMGVYIVTVIDNKGCTAVSAATINSPPPLTGQFTKGTANCTGCGCKEWLMVTASGGTSPYSYSWPDGYVNRYKNQLCPGTYTVNIKDKNGCSVNLSLTTP